MIKVSGYIQMSCSFHKPQLAVICASLQYNKSGLAGQQLNQELKVEFVVDLLTIFQDNSILQSYLHSKTIVCSLALPFIYTWPQGIWKISFQLGSREEAGFIYKQELLLRCGSQTTVCHTTTV